MADTSTNGRGQADAIEPVVELGDLHVDHVVMTDAEGARIANRLWSLNVGAVRLATEKDDTFLLETSDHERYVLKISNPAEDPMEIDFETSAMEHARARGVRVQQLLPDVHGRRLAPVRDDAGQDRFARLMTFVEGIPLDSTSANAREREQVGETLADLRLAMADFSHPAAGRRYAWDLMHFGDLKPLLDSVVVPEHRALLAEGFERYMTVVAPHVPGLRRQPLHNDFSTSNIIVDHDAPAFVRGIIDFGDAVTTAIAIDVSTALLNQLPRKCVNTDDVFLEARDLLRGYLSRAELTAEELALIPHLVMGRVIARALITVHRAGLMPRNRDYILRNTDQGWAQLAWFQARPHGQITSIFM